MNTSTDTGALRREKLDNLVARLSKGVPNDPKPATTRALLGYLRTLQTCGPEELYESIMNNLYASVAALRVYQGSDSAACVTMALMLNKCAEDFLGREAEGTKQ